MHPVAFKVSQWPTWGRRYAIKRLREAATDEVSYLKELQDVPGVVQLQGEAILKKRSVATPMT